MTRLLLSFALVCTVVSCSSCAAIKGEAKEAASNYVDCMKPQLVEAAGELGSVLQPAVEQLLSDTGHVDKSGFKALVGELKSDAAGCAIATVVARLSKPRDQGAPLAAPLAIDVPELQAAWADTRREQFGGRTFALGDS